MSEFRLKCLNVSCSWFFSWNKNQNLSNFQACVWRSWLKNKFIWKIKFRYCTSLRRDFRIAIPMEYRVVVFLWGLTRWSLFYYLNSLACKTIAVQFMGRISELNSCTGLQPHLQTNGAEAPGWSFLLYRWLKPNGNGAGIKAPRCCTVFPGRQTKQFSCFMPAAGIKKHLVNCLKVTTFKTVKPKQKLK